GVTRSEPSQLAEIRLKDAFHANALVRGRYKLYEDVSKGRMKLFDLEADPKEQHDLADEEPALRAELETELRAAIAAAEEKGLRFGAGEKADLSPEEVEHLEKLGCGGAEEPSTSSDKR